MLNRLLAVLYLASFGALAMGLLSRPVIASERIEGPLAAEILSVIDGDTLEVKVQIWLGQDIITNVRLRGIDAPEMRGRCQHEKDIARAAAQHLAAVATGLVKLSNVQADKYGGRVLADVATQDGEQIAAIMLRSGLVRTYDGGTRLPWCSAAK